MQNLKGTRCEVCENRVQFNGAWYCTVATCKPTFAVCSLESDYEYYSFFDMWDGEDPCTDCNRAQDCPYQSHSFPLAYGK